MRAYIIRRLLLLIPTLIIVSLVIFMVIRFIPGDIVDAKLAQLQETGAPIAQIETQRAELLKEYGLDSPIIIQYGRWMGVVPQADGGISGIFQGNLGTSMLRQTPVIDEIAARWPVTFELGLLAFIVAELTALIIGIISALRQNTWVDYIARSFAIFCIAVPGFWLGTMIIVFPSMWWGYMPPILLTKFIDDPIGNLRMFIIPATVLGLGMAGVTMRMTRTMMLEVLRQDYIRTAWSKGLKERVVISRHSLKNALIPIITLMGYDMAIMIGGSVIIEQIFVLPGIGRLLIDAILTRDYPLVSGIMLFFGIGMVLINLGIDLTYGLLDPRVHYKKKRN